MDFPYDSVVTSLYRGSMTDTSLQGHHKSIVTCKFASKRIRNMERNSKIQIFVNRCLSIQSQEKDQSTTHRTSNQTKEVETDRARFQKKNDNSPILDYIGIHKEIAGGKSQKHLYLEKGNSIEI